MNLEERSFAGEFFRPKPKVIISENPATALIITSWGQSDESEQVIQFFQEQLRMELGFEATTPFGQIESLGVRGNQLRTAAILANDYLLKSANRTEYIAAVEFLGLVYDQGVLSWVQIGSPHLVLRHQERVQPLAFSLDYSWQYQQKSPLLSQALGLEAFCQLNCGSLQVQGPADLFLVSRDQLSQSVFQKDSLDLKSLTKILVQESNASPFWVGHLTL